MAHVLCMMCVITADKVSCLSLCLWAMAYGHSSGLPHLKAPVMIAEKHKLFYLFSFQSKLLSQVMEVDVDMLTCQVTEGLTEDAVSARLHQGGLVPPLYLHSSIHARQDRQISESTVEAEWEQRVSQLFRSQVGQSGFIFQVLNSSSN